MILIAVAWILLTISFLGWGKLIAAGFGPSEARQDFSETGYLFMGISIAGILSGIWWVFAPINEIFGGGLLGIGMGYALGSLPIKPEISFRNPWFLMASVFFFLALLIKAAAPTSFYDCGLYYVQTMRWAQQFPVVPGLANVHVRFGNASVWHMLSAAFNWSVVFQGSFDDLGELLLFWFLLFHSWNVLKMEGFERYLSLALVFFAVWQSQQLLSSPSPDLAAGILGMQTMWQFRKFLRLWNPREPNQLNTRGLALFVQSIFLAQIKLSAIPFLVIAAVVVFLIVREGWYLRACQLLFLGICVAASMIARSYILSGYLLFPVLQGGFSPDWLIPRGLVVEYLDGVKGFARHSLSRLDLQTGKTHQDYGRVGFWIWFPLWCAERRLTDWIAMVSGVSGWLLLVRYASTNIRRSFLSHWPIIFYTWLSGMMLLFWFSNAPDVRFGMAILGTGFAYTFACIAFWLEPRLPVIPTASLRFLPVLAISVGCLWFWRDQRSLRQYPVFPPSYQKVEISTYPTITGQNAFTPKDVQRNWFIDGDQCWDAPLPCSFNAIPDLEFRGSQPGDGFRIQVKDSLK